MRFLLGGNPLPHRASGPPVDRHHDEHVHASRRQSAAWRVLRFAADPTGTAVSTNRRSSQTTGDACPRPGISTFQRMFFVSLHSSGGLAWRHAGRIGSPPLRPVAARRGRLCQHHGRQRANDEHPNNQRQTEVFGSTVVSFRVPNDKTPSRPLPFQGRYSDRKAVEEGLARRDARGDERRQESSRQHE